MDTNKAYSINGQDYPYRDVKEALEALSVESRLVEGEIYYESDREDISPERFLDADDVLEMATEQFCDLVGEIAEDAFTVSAQAKDELDALLKAWARNHVHGQYWRCVGERRENKVTAEDVAGKRKTS